MCAILVDVSRLAVYSTRYASDAEAITQAGGWWLVAGSTAMAILGAILGARLVRKVTMVAVHIVVGMLLVVVGALLATGLV